MTNIRSPWWCLLLGIFLGACPSEHNSECSLDSDCPVGRYCQGDRCAFDCTFHEECPAGYRCTDRGRCERGCVETNNGIEACDHIDNDCDEQTDEDFIDLGLACDFGCEAGTFDCSADGSQTVCNAPHPAPDDSECNGLDDDCDDSTDEDALERLCPLQEGLCAGVSQVCLGSAGYSPCDYGPLYTDSVDSACDGVDEDCDGLTDEDAQMELAPEEGAQAQDGLDNNCNGLVDEPGGVIVPHEHHSNVWMDAYESTVFSNSDCTGDRFGEGDVDDFPLDFPVSGAASVQLYACSLPDLVPSGYLSWYRAKRVCEAQGKRLCTALEWKIGCSDGQSRVYPYGINFIPGVCNDGWGGAGQAVATGSYTDCTGAGRKWDTSGNLSEWTSDFNTVQTAEALVGGGSYECAIPRADGTNLTCDMSNDQHLSSIGHMSSCDVDDNDYRDSYLPESAYPYLGVRCCMDGP